jgi:hypothetical protein
LDSVIEAREEHLSKADDSIVVTESGRIMVVSDLQSEKA